MIMIPTNYSVLALSEILAIAQLPSESLEAKLSKAGLVHLAAYNQHCRHTTGVSNQCKHWHWVWLSWFYYHFPYPECSSFSPVHSCVPFLARTASCECSYSSKLTLQYSIRRVWDLAQSQRYEIEPLSRQNEILELTGCSATAW